MRHKLSYLQNRNRLIDMENRLVVAKWAGGGSGMDWELGVSRYKLLRLEWINNVVLLCSTGNYIQSLGIEHDGRWSEKKNIHINVMYIYSHYTVQQKLAQH